jgi:hypothetical protein
MREYEANRKRQCELRHEWLEIVAVGAKAMQPNDRPVGARARFNLDGIEHLYDHLWP